MVLRREGREAGAGPVPREASPRCELAGSEFDVLDHLAHDEALGGDIDDGEVGVDPAHDGGGGQRVSTLPTEARRSRLGGVLDENADLLGSDGEIHRAADTGRKSRIVGCPIGEVAFLRHLARPKQCQIEMTAADHQKRVGMVDIAAAGHQGDRLLAGVDQIPVDLVVAGGGPDAEDAVLIGECITEAITAGIKMTLDNYDPLRHSRVSSSQFFAGHRDCPSRQRTTRSRMNLRPIEPVVAERATHSD